MNAVRWTLFQTKFDKPLPVRRLDPRNSDGNFRTGPAIASRSTKLIDNRLPHQYLRFV